MRCDVCGGSGKIALPVLHPITMANDESVTFVSSRVYDCPECQMIPKRDTEIFSIERSFNTHPSLPAHALQDIIESVLLSSAAEIGKHLIRSGAMIVSTFEDHEGIRARVGLRVVAKNLNPEKTNLEAEARLIIEDMERKGMIRAEDS